MLLDTGASHPILAPRDFRYLGIDPEDYPACSSIEIQGIGSNHFVKMYEMYVTVTDPNCVPLVDPDRPVWPQQRKHIGIVAPVICMSLPGVRPMGPVKVNAEGVAETSRTPIDVAREEARTRLSGMLPFTACYISSTPGRGNGRIWLGEDRRDVLGAHRMPGQQRSAMPNECRTNHPAWDHVERIFDDTPSIRFEHSLLDGGKLIDEEWANRPGRSVVRVLDAQGRENAAFQIFPGQGYQLSKLVRSHGKARQGPAKRGAKKAKGGRERGAGAKNVG